MTIDPSIYPVIRATNETYARTAYTISAPTSVATRRLRKLQRLATQCRFQNPRTRGLMANPPTVTATTTAPASSGMTRRFQVMGGANPVFRIFGGSPTPMFGGDIIVPSQLVNGSPASHAYRVKVAVDCTKFAIHLRQWQGGCGTRLLVDGQYVSLSQTQAATLAEESYIVVDFTSAGGRKVRYIVIEFRAATAFFGIWTPITEGAHQPAVETLRSFSVGDSWTDGTSNDVYAHDNFCTVRADLLGIQDNWNGGIGGTGWLNVSGANGGFRTRIMDVVKAAPDVLFLDGGHNDTLFSPGEVYAEVVAYLRLLRSFQQTQETIVFVSGPHGRQTGPSAAMIAVENAIASAVAYVADENTFFIPICTDPAGPWFTGSGKNGAPAGDGNCDLYIGADTDHPSGAGAAFYGTRHADAVIRILSTILV